MIVRIVAILASLAGVAGAIFAYNAALTEAANARADAEHQADRAATWKAAYDSLIDERELWDELLIDHEHAIERVNRRRKQAESRYQQALLELAEVRRWARTAVPGAVADGLCQQPGSCTRDNGLLDTGQSAAASTGTAASDGEGWRLTNNSLRRGVEDCREALGRANAGIDSIREWNESKKVKR